MVYYILVYGCLINELNFVAMITSEPPVIVVTVLLLLSKLSHLEVVHAGVYINLLMLE